MYLMTIILPPYCTGQGPNYWNSEADKLPYVQFLQIWDTNTVDYIIDGNRIIHLVLLKKKIKFYNDYNTYGIYFILQRHYKCKIVLIVYDYIVN